jgi:hypothetical protein
MEEEKKPELTLKMVLKCGQVFALHTNEEDVPTLMYGREFIKMNDKFNDIFVAIEDISAFEILNYRKEPTAEPVDAQRPESV